VWPDDSVRRDGAGCPASARLGFRAVEAGQEGGQMGFGSLQRIGPLVGFVPKYFGVTVLVNSHIDFHSRRILGPSISG
jgi:hypothetical protein